MSNVVHARHVNYELLNLIGYGLAKFDSAFWRQLGYTSKTQFFSHVVQCGIAEQVGVVKNRQDLFDPYFPENPRKGWWQKKEVYIHRKHHIDALFGELDAPQFSAMVQEIITAMAAGQEAPIVTASPIATSKYKQLQSTGMEAELFFEQHYELVAQFKGGVLKDARPYGDGYDFQIQVNDQFLLAEVKGVRAEKGNIRMTEKEHAKAKEYGLSYGLVVVSNLAGEPHLTPIFNPAAELSLKKKAREQPVIEYHSESFSWHSHFAPR